MKIKLIHTILFFFSSISLFTENCNAQNFVSQEFTTLGGMPSNTVYSSFQDSKGYIWFATDKGIVKYNGVELKTFTSADGLSDNEFFDIFEDSQHRIWFASFNGEPCFYKNQKFYNASNCGFLANTDFKGPAFKVLEDKNGVVFYMTHFSIYKINKKNKLETIKLKDYLFSNLYLNSNKEVIVVALNEKRINTLYNLTKNKLENSNSEANVQIYTKVFSEGKDVYYSLQNEIYHYSPKLVKHTLFEHNSIIQSITKIKNAIWVGTSSGLIVTEDFKKKKRYFKDYSISSAMEDKEKNIWITSINKGILFIPNTKIKEFDEKCELGFEGCHSIKKFENNCIAIGSTKGDFAFKIDNKITPIQLNNSIGAGIVNNIQKFENHYYVSTGMSIIKLNLEGKVVAESKLGIKDFYIKNKDSVFVVGGIGLMIYDLKSLMNLRAITAKNQRKFTVAQIKANDIEVVDNQVFIFGLFGVKQFKSGKLMAFYSGRLFKKNITDITKTDDGIYWLSSSVNGLIGVYKGKVFNFTQKDKLPSNYVNCVVKGNKNELFLGTINGLSQVNYKVEQGKLKIKVQNFNVSHGLSSNEINNITIDKKVFYVATKSGLSIFQIDNLRNNEIKPSLILEKIKLNNKVITKSENLIFNSNQNDIQLYLQGFSYKSFGKISYLYRFVGENNTWKTTRNPKIEFLKLEAGKYTIELKAKNIFQQFSTSIFVNFEILPHFYETVWFYSACVLFTILFIFLFVRFRLKKIQKHHRLKQRLLRLENENLKVQNSETLLQKEYIELEQKALMLQMNPHFIFNSINTIQGLYRSDKIRADDYLIKFSNLLRKILEFSKKKIIDLEQEIKFLENYLEINKLRFDNNFEYFFEIAENIDPQVIEIAPLIIQPFVENALIHGIQTVKNDARIYLRFYIKDAFLICEVEDNGIGREKSETINKNRIHHSLGMEITEKRLNYFNNQKNSIKIVDLYDEKNQACGTRVLIFLNLNEI